MSVLRRSDDRIAQSKTKRLLSKWDAARDSSLTSVADIVCITDSIGVLGNNTVSKPWPWLLSKSLSAFEWRKESLGWLFADGSHFVPDIDTLSGGTSSTAGAGGYCRDMAVASTASITADCDGVSVVWSRQPGGGNLEVRDGGSGGTLKATISTAGAARASMVTTVDFTTYANRNVHITCTTAGARLEGIYIHAGDQTIGRRVWVAGHSGYKTSDFVGSSALAADLVTTLNPDLTIIATGYNDVDATTYEADLKSLIDIVRARTTGDIAVMAPWAGGFPDVTKAKHDVAERVAGSKGCEFIDWWAAFGSVMDNVDPWDLSLDGAHPTAGASSLIGELVLSRLVKDPISAAITTAMRGPHEMKGTLFYDLSTLGTAKVGAYNLLPVVQVSAGNTVAGASSVFGHAVLQVKLQEADANAQVYAFDSVLAGLLGLPGAGVGLGAGGASAVDTFLTRSAAGIARVKDTLAVDTAVTVGTNPATSGGVRSANNAIMRFRNAANSADVDGFNVNASNVVTVGGANQAGVTIGSPAGGTGTVTINTANFGATAVFGPAATFADGLNFAVGTTTGTKFGTSASQKIGFFNATAIVQPTTAVAAATFVAGAGTAVNDASTFDGYTLKQVVKALRNLGLLA